MKKLRLNQLFTKWTKGDGIFSYIIKCYGDNPPDWLKDVNKILDIDFHGAYGNRYISPLVSGLLDEYGNLILDDDNQVIVDDDGYRVVLNTYDLEAMADVCYQRHHLQWEKIWEVLNLEYNPIENYSMEEEGEDTDNGVHTRRDNLSDTHSGTDTHTYNNVKDTQSGNVENENAVKGYNSSTYAPSSKSTNTYNNVENNKTGNETDGYNSSITHGGTQTNETDLTKTHTFRRAGNIGITTSQQMQQSSLELWKYDFYKQVYEMVANLLTISYYGGVR